MSGPSSLTVAAGRDVPVLGFCSDEPYDPERFVPPTNVLAASGKPEGGLWLSPLTNEPGHKPNTDWADWLRGAYDEDRPIHPVTLRTDARVLVIDSAGDFEAVNAAYPPPPTGLPADLDKTMDALGGRGLDYEALADDFDAIWLTSAGRVATKYLRPGLNTWDVETVLVLRPSVALPMQSD